MSIPDDDRDQRRDEASEQGEIIGPSPEELEHINLYFGGLQTYPHIPTLASHWLEELAKEGLSDNWQKQSRQVNYQPGAAEGDLLCSVQLENGQTLWLLFQFGGILVLDEYPRRDLAILGALAALEAGEVDVALIRRTLFSVDGSVDEALRQFDDPRQPRERRMVRFASALLRHYRPEFNDLPYNKQRELLTQACERINEICKAQRKLAEFLEFGSGAPGKKLRAQIQDAILDVHLAKMHDMEGISYPELGDLFGIPQTQQDKVKRDNQKVRNRVKKGRELLDQALDGEWDAMAAQRRSYSRRPKNR